MNNMTLETDYSYCEPQLTKLLDWIGTNTKAKAQPMDFPEMPGYYTVLVTDLSEHETKKLIEYEEFLQRDLDLEEL